MIVDSASTRRNAASFLRTMREVLPSDHDYWRSLVEKVLESAAVSSEKMTKLTLRMIAEDVADHPISPYDSDSPYLAKIPYRTLRSFGRPDDPESSVGFYLAQSPFPQPDPDNLLIYAPCAFSPTTRLAYGPEILTLCALQQDPRLDVARYYECATRRYRRLISQTRRRPAAPIARLTYEANRFKQQAALYFRTPGSQNYYEEGIRFYLHQRKGNSYTTATTPGLLLPDEYYGSVYFPGITRLVPPGALGAYFKTNGTSQHGRRAFDTWRFLLKAQLFGGPEAAAAKNPFRLAYFENGYLPARDTHYLIMASSAHRALQEASLRWSDRGLADDYAEDSVCLARHALAHSQLVRVVHSTPRTDDLARLTLMSSGYCLISDRDPERKKINHGRVVNWSARIHLAALFAMCVSVGIEMSTLGLALGLGTSTFIETVTPGAISALQGRQLRSIKQAFDAGTPLAQVIAPATNRTLDRQIARWVDRRSPMHADEHQ